MVAQNPTTQPKSPDWRLHPNVRNANVLLPHPIHAGQVRHIPATEHNRSRVHIVIRQPNLHKNNKPVLPQLLPAHLHNNPSSVVFGAGHNR